ncbi:MULTISPECIES: hypothetical protein [Acinetobacter]|nr:hypothetical protein [Acinetobacter haemolyticus]NAR50315.1 hypothetical protein [Acinetobacter haemolyticus]NAR57530.1 hypothetical protein [Acinetobacter haemolyticus]NAR80863.1 hypothetical protein [Acinetobacter haemolyticus]NAR95604.1 hypothetical protein [Acinetobacter haemolyticus]NAS09288.1 hypothetical protein [Acinetobacter haemolyticus]
MKKFLLYGALFALVGCTSLQGSKDDALEVISDPLDELLYNQKIIDANYKFYNLKDYQTDPVFLKAINNYYKDLPREVSIGHSIDSVDFGRNHFFIRHSIDTKIYRGPIKINNRQLLKKIFVEEQCKGLFANSKAIKKKGGMGITQTYYFVQEKFRVVMDMNTLECKN